MRHSIILLSILLFLNCGGKYGLRQQTQLIPDVTSGCEKFKNRERAICEAGLIKELQQLWNAGKLPNTIKIKKLKSERKDDLWVTYTYQYTLSEHVQFLVLDDEYEPTFLGLLYDKTFWFGSGFITGLIFGFQAGK